MIKKIAILKMGNFLKEILKNSILMNKMSKTINESSF